MHKKVEEFYFAVAEGDRRYSTVLIVKVSGSDLYVFNSEARGAYHVSLHEDGRSHVKVQGEGSLRLVGKEETVKLGKVFVFKRSTTPNKAVIPLNILIGTVNSWTRLGGSDNV